MKTPSKSKARTPSGTIITQRAGDIRGFFSPEEENLTVQVNSPFTGSQKVKIITQPRKAVSFKRSTQTVSSKAVKHDKTVNKQRSVKSPTNEKKNKLSDDLFFTPPTTPIKTLRNRVVTPISTKSKIKRVSAINEVKMPETVEVVTPPATDVSIKATHISPEIAKARKEIQMAMQNLQEKIQTEDCVTDVISIRSVMTMFKKLEEKIEAIEVKQHDSARESEASEQVRKLDTRINAIQSKAAAQSDITGIQKELQHYRMMTKVQGGLIQRMSDSIAEMSNRLDSLEITVNKKSITVTNLLIDNRKYIGLKQISDFFNDTLGFRPPIKDYFTVGQGFPPLLVVIFERFQDKQWVMQNKSDLKGILTDGKPHYINEYLPVAINEKRRKEKEVKSMLQEQCELSYERGKLKVDGAYYFDAVLPPKPEAIVDLSLQQ